jgi:hypothetical protein
MIEAALAERYGRISGPSGAATKTRAAGANPRFENQAFQN